MDKINAYTLHQRKLPIDLGKGIKFFKGTLIITHSRFSEIAKMENKYLIIFSCFLSNHKKSPPKYQNQSLKLCIIHISLFFKNLM